MANNAVVGLLRVLLTADTAQFDAGMRKVSTSTKASTVAMADMSKQATTLGGTLTKALNFPMLTMGAAGIATSLVALGRAAMKTGSEIKDLSLQTGLTYDEIQRLGFAGAQVGLSMDTVARAVNRLQRELVNGDAGAVGALNKLGLNLQDLQRMGPAEMFETLSRGIAKLPDPAQRTAVAWEVMGRSAAELLPLMLGNIDELTRGFRGMSKEAVEAADRFDDLIAKATILAKSTFANAAELLMRHGNPITAAIEESKRKQREALSQDSSMPLPDAPSLFQKPGAPVLKSAKEAMADFKQTMADFKPTMDGLTKSMKEAAAAAEKARDVQDHLWGLDVINRAKEMTSQIGELANVSKFLPEVQAEILTSVEKAIAVYERWGDTAPESLTKIRDVLRPLVAANDLAANVETNIGAIVFRLTQLGTTVSRLFPSLQTVAFDPKSITGATTVNLKAPSFLATFSQQLKEATSGFANMLGPTILQALTGGGSVSQSVGGLAGLKIGESLNATLGGVLKRSLGQRVGGIVSSIIPGLGALMGPLISSAISGIGRLFGIGPSELDKVKEARAEWLKAQGGLEKLHKTLGAVAGDAKVRAAFAELFNARTVKEYEAALAKFNATVSEAQDAINKQLAEEQDAREFLQATLEKYGVTVDDMGERWRQQAITDQAELLIREYTAMTASGMDHNRVLQLMGDNLGEFFRTALKTGAEVPRQLEPLLRQMIEQGVLLDENGDAFGLQALDAVHWSQTLTENIQKVIDKLDELIGAITGKLGKAVEEIPPLEIPVIPIFNKAYGHGGGIEVPALASGGFIRQPTLAMLHAGEAVVPLDQAPDFGFGVGHTTVIFEQDGRRNAEYMIRNIPGAVQRIRRWR